MVVLRRQHLETPGEQGVGEQGGMGEGSEERREKGREGGRKGWTGHALKSGCRLSAQRACANIKR